MTLHQVAAFLTDPGTTHPSFPVIDARAPCARHRRSAGRAALAARRTSIARPRLGSCRGRRKVPVAYPDEYLEGLVDRMTEANVAHIPVISREDASLVGYLGWKDLLRIRDKQKAEETERTVLYRVR